MILMILINYYHFIIITMLHIFASIFCPDFVVVAVLLLLTLLLFKIILLIILDMIININNIISKFVIIYYNCIKSLKSLHFGPIFRQGHSQDFYEFLNLLCRHKKSQLRLDRDNRAGEVGPTIEDTFLQKTVQLYASTSAQAAGLEHRNRRRQVGRGGDMPSRAKIT